MIHIMTVDNNNTVLCSGSSYFPDKSCFYGSRIGKGEYDVDLDRVLAESEASKQFGDEPICDDCILKAMEML